MSFAKRWCFTLNNYTEEDITRLNAWLVPKICVFAIVGKEVADTTGTPHLQGFAHFRAKKTFRAMQKLLPGAHVEIARGTDYENDVYCRKGGDILLQIGEPNDMPITTNHSYVDAHRLAQLVAGGGDLYELVSSCNEFKAAYAKHQRFVDTLVKKKEGKAMEEAYYRYFRDQNFVFYKWQMLLFDELISTPPNPRRIVWYIDRVGGSGKSTFVAVCISRGATDAVRYGVVKPQDMALSYKGERVVFFDIARSSMDLLPLCALMEELKNGEIFSGKYESCTKRFAPPHVVVFANYGPPNGAFSEDRLDVRFLNIKGKVLEKVGGSSQDGIPE